MSSRQPVPDIMGNILAANASMFSQENIRGALAWVPVARVYDNPYQTRASYDDVAGLIRAGIQARYYHAKRLEQGWFDDMSGDTANAVMYRRVRVLVIDEVDKINFKSDWTRGAFSELMDERYRTGLAGKTCTMLISQHDPVEAVPGDVASRMADGRFYRQWKGGKNRHTVSRAEWGPGLWVPGIVHVQGQDMRPYLR